MKTPSELYIESENAGPVVLTDDMLTTIVKGTIAKGGRYTFCPDRRGYLLQCDAACYASASLTALRVAALGVLVEADTEVPVIVAWNGDGGHNGYFAWIRTANDATGQAQTDGTMRANSRSRVAGVADL